MPIRIEGVVQHYAWGDPAFIPKLLGVEPDGTPWAELWLGTHPTGPARLADGRLLSDVTGALPYLLKVLAAAEPLSLQTHPNQAQAVDGFGRGVYPDSNAKPELLCALTPFQALCGLRPIDSAIELFDELGLDEHELTRIASADGPGAAFEALLGGAIDPRPIIDRCQTNDRPEAEWVRALAIRYPADPSVAATLLLNYVRLEPGQALRLDPGNLHAYLDGVGIELMGPSDNVIRGGLTVKPVDVDELLHVVDRQPLTEPVLADSTHYDLPGAHVTLRRLKPGAHHRAIGHELAIDMDGGTWYYAPGDHVEITTTTFVVVPMF